MADGKLSKPKTEEELREEKLEAELVRIFGPACFFTVISGAMLFTARQAMAAAILKDPAELTQFLAKLASAGAAFELIANPIAGKLSDVFGRRALMPVGNVPIIIVRSLLFLNPDKLWPLVLEQSLGIPMVTAYFTNYRAALADQLSPAGCARANAKIGMSIGMSVVAGPLIAGAVMKRSNPKYCYLISIGLAASSLTWLMTQFKETLSVDKRKPLSSVTLSDIQPFSFMQLMKTRVYQRLLLVSGMQSFSEGRNVTDPLMVYLQSDLGWTWEQINQFVGVYGLALIFSAITVKPLIAKVGLIGFTSFSNLCNAVGLVAWSAGQMGLGSIFMAPGGRKRDAVESIMMELGSAQYGKGFVSAAMMNFRSIVNIISPMMFGAIYAWGVKRKFPGAVFVAAALTVVLAEGALQTLTKDELGLDRHGQQKKKVEAAPTSTHDGAGLKTIEAAPAGASTDKN